MKKNIFVPVYPAAALLIITLLISACATTSEIPGWVNSPPENNSEYTYFIGIGSDKAGDQGAASAEAASLIISEITKYLGVRVSSNTTAEARDAYGEFESKLTAVVNEKFFCEAYRSYD